MVGSTILTEKKMVRMKKSSQTFGPLKIDCRKGLLISRELT